MEERYRATTQNRFCPDMFKVNKNITVEAKLISIASSCQMMFNNNNNYYYYYYYYY